MIDSVIDFSSPLFRLASAAAHTFTAYIRRGFSGNASSLASRPEAHESFAQGAAFRVSPAALVAQMVAVATPELPLAWRQVTAYVRDGLEIIKADLARRQADNRLEALIGPEG